jgi:MerR family copper efflux transcriptional regulator
MNIGTAAARSGVQPKTIRYYEGIGLIPAADRRANNYRDYTERDIQTLRFIHRARGLGFSVKEVANLLALWRDDKRTSHDVKALAIRHVEDIDRKVSELLSMKRTLMTLVEKCHSDSRPDCPILEDLAAGGEIGAAHRSGRGAPGHAHQHD